MQITKAVITAASRKQRALPLQTLIDSDGADKSVLTILVEEALRAGIEEIAVVVCPGDETPYAEAAGAYSNRLRFVHQAEPRGYGHAIWCARDFVGDAPFLHLVGDHLYVSEPGVSCAQALVRTAEAQGCAVSSVQPSRESLLPYYGCVGGRRVPGSAGLYQIERVLEKPTPTEAEQWLTVPGLRAGHYLCFFGQHVLTRSVIDLLDDLLRRAASGHAVMLSDALALLAQRERYLALESSGRRYDIGVRYGMLQAQLALALNGRDRDEVLTRLLELLANGPTGRKEG